MRPAVQIIVVPHLNGDLLGDKIVLSAIVTAAMSSGRGTKVWGIEGKEKLRMAYYGDSPARILSWNQDVLIRALPRILGEKQDHRLSVLLCHDSNSCIDRSDIRATNVCMVDLWQELSALARRGIFPRIHVRENWVRQAQRILRQAFDRVPQRFVAMHARALARASCKNTDHDFLCQLARHIVRYHQLPVVIIGRGDERPLFGSDRVVDLLGSDLDVEETAGLLSLASAYIGPDSGPMHLAAAVGCRVSGIGYTTRRFGPFVPEHQFIGFFRPRGDGNTSRSVSLETIARHVAAGACHSSVELPR